MSVKKWIANFSDTTTQLSSSCLPVEQTTSCKKIAHVVYPAIPMPVKVYGGVERGVYLLACEQAARGHTVYVFAHSQSIIPECTVIGCPYKNEEQAKWKMYDLVRKAHLQYHFDIIHDHSPWGLFGYTNMKCPVVRTIYGDPFKKFCHTLRKDSLLTFTTHGFAEFYGYPNADIIRVTTCANMEQVPFNAGVRGNWLLFIGLMAEWKGPHTAIQWAKKLKYNIILFGPIAQKDFFNSNIEPILTHIIKGDMQKAITRIETIKTGTAVVYGGAIDRVHIWEAYCQAHAVLITSQCEEGMSLVAQEAMLTGCPVYGVPSGGLWESMGEGIGGALSNDVNEIISLDKDLEIWYNAENARNHILSTRTASVMADSVDKIYQKVWNT